MKRIRKNESTLFRQIGGEKTNKGYIVDLCLFQRHSKNSTEKRISGRELLDFKLYIIG